MPAFSKDKSEGPGTTPVQEQQSSKFLPKGKYFLLFILLIGQVVGAYVIVDEYYQDVYVFVFGSMPDYSETYAIDEIIVNPSGSNAQRFLVVEIGMELSHGDHVILVDRNIMKIRDRLNEVLSSRTVNELIRYKERENLRVELAEEINEIIGVRSVRNLYFTKYVMQ